MKKPTLRFPSFVEDWESKTVDDLFEKVKTKNIDGLNTNVITNSAEYGLIPQSDFFDKEIAVEGNTDKYTVISQGDFVYNPRKSSNAPYGPFNCYKLKDDGIVSPLYICLRPKYPELTEYLLWYFKTSKWHSYIYSNGSQGGARHDRVGMTDDLMKGIPVTIPTIEEQKKIVNALSSVDKRIKLQEKVVEDYEIQKMSLMKQIFSQEISFTDENGDAYESWENLRLGDICEYRRGSFPQPYGLAKWYDEENGKPFIQVADINDNMQVNPDTNRHISSEAENLSVFVPAGTLLITLQGSIGKVAITNYDAYVDRTLLIIQKINADISLEFFKYALFVLFDEEKKIADGGIIKTITKETLTNFVLPIPSLAEQEKITNFLSLLDKKIVAEKELLLDYENLKKALLQQLFV